MIAWFLVGCPFVFETPPKVVNPVGDTGVQTTETATADSMTSQTGLWVDTSPTLVETATPPDSGSTPTTGVTETVDTGRVVSLTGATGQTGDTGAPDTGQTGHTGVGHTGDSGFQERIEWGFDGREMVIRIVRECEAAADITFTYDIETFSFDAQACDAALPGYEVKQQVNWGACDEQVEVIVAGESLLLEVTTVALIEGLTAVIPSLPAQVCGNNLALFEQAVPFGLSGLPANYQITALMPDHITDKPKTTSVMWDGQLFEFVPPSSGDPWPVESVSSGVDVVVQAGGSDTSDPQDVTILVSETVP